jgi:hypothetical protein
MPLFRANERNAVESIARLTYCNPLDAEFTERERSILGSDYVPHGAVWSLRAETYPENPALAQLAVISERIAGDTRARLLRGASANSGELTLYAYCVIYALYQRYADQLHQVHVAPAHGRRRVTCYQRFSRDVQHFLV